MREYAFEGLRDVVKKVVNECECTKSKSARHKPYGLLQPIEKPDRAWKSISMDFITKLPLSQDPVTKEKYDSIMVIPDRLTKYGRFVPCKESFNVK